MTTVLLVYRHIGKKCVKALQLHQTAPLVGGNTVYIRLPTPCYSQKAGFKPCFKGPMHSILALAFITKTRSKAMYHLDVLGNIEVGRAWKHASQEGGYHDGNMLVLHLKSGNNSKSDTGKDTKKS